MAELKGYIYDEIKTLARKRKEEAEQLVVKKYENEIERAKIKAQKEIIPKVLKIVKVSVSFSSYDGSPEVSAEIPREKRQIFEEKYKKLVSVVQNKIDAEKKRIQEQYETWLCEFATKGNDGIVIDLPRFE